MIIKSVGEKILFKFLDVEIIEANSNAGKIKVVKIYPPFWENVQILLSESDLDYIAKSFSKITDQQDIKLINNDGHSCVFPKEVMEVIIKWACTSYTVKDANYNVVKEINPQELN